MDPLKAGVGLAAVVAGPQLWSLVQSGDISTEGALLRAGLVAAGCAFGVVGINRLVQGFAVDQARARRIKKALAALDEGVHEGQPIPSRGPAAGRPELPAGPGPAANP